MLNKVSEMESYNSQTFLASDENIINNKENVRIMSQKGEL
jgi:hypothetical protein